MGIRIMKKIPLSKTGKHKGKFYTLVDDEYYDWLNQFNWSISLSHGRYYAIRRGRKYEKTTEIRMHNFILGITNGGRKIIGDHKNGDSLDNQQHNLRKCTSIQNSYNRKIQKGSSKFKGVCWNKYHRKWCASISFKGKQMHLGDFDTEIEGAKAYNRASIKHHGKYARPNTIPKEVKGHPTIPQ